MASLQQADWQRIAQLVIDEAIGLANSEPKLRNSTLIYLDYKKHGLVARRDIDEVGSRIAQEVLNATIPLAWHRTEHSEKRFVLKVQRP